MQSCCHLQVSYCHPREAYRLPPSGCTPCSYHRTSYLLVDAACRIPTACLSVGFPNYGVRDIGDCLLLQAGFLRSSGYLFPFNRVIIICSSTTIRWTFERRCQCHGLPSSDFWPFVNIPLDFLFLYLTISLLFIVPLSIWLWLYPHFFCIIRIGWKIYLVGWSTRIAELTSTSVGWERWFLGLERLLSIFHYPVVRCFVAVFSLWDDT